MLGTTRLLRVFCSVFAAAALASALLAASGPAAPLPPAIDSESVSGITGHDAVLEAQVNPQDEERGVYYQFQLAGDPAEFAAEFTCPTEGFPAGTSLCAGLASQQGALPIGELGPATADQPVSLDLEGAGASLAPGTAYHYRVIAARRIPTEDTTQWEEPIVYGPDRTFTTASEPPPTGGPTPPPPPSEGTPLPGPPSHTCAGHGNRNRHHHPHHRHRRHAHRHHRPHCGPRVTPG